MESSKETLCTYCPRRSETARRVASLLGREDTPAEDCPTKGPVIIEETTLGIGSLAPGFLGVSLLRTYYDACPKDEPEVMALFADTEGAPQAAAPGEAQPDAAAQAAQPAADTLPPQPPHAV